MRKVVNGRMYGYVYEIRNKITGELYIGRHKWEISGEIDKSYFGSGKRIRQQIEKYGKDSFEVKCIAEAETRDELIRMEEAAISEYKQRCQENLLNISNRGGSGFDTSLWPKDRREAYLINQSNNNKKSNAHLHFGRVDGQYNGRYGKPVSKDTREKISNKNKGRIQSNEEREMRRAAHMTKCPDVKPPSCIGKIWITNGKEDKLVYLNEIHNFSGFYRGRTFMKGKKKA